MESIRMSLKYRFILSTLTLLIVSRAGFSAGVRADLDGVWNLAHETARESVTTGSPPILFTEVGQTFNDTYNYLTDDPHMQCIPASVSRIMLTPSPLFEIRQHSDYIEINYEFMDVKRIVPLDPDLSLEDAPLSTPEFPHLGRSIAWYEGEELFIETTDIQEGVFSTHVLVGYPQSNQMHTIEHFIPDGDRLETLISHTDPVYYEEPFEIIYRHVRTPHPLLEWGCVPEKACVDPRECGE